MLPSPMGVACWLSGKIAHVLFILLGCFNRNSIVHVSSVCSHSKTILTMSRLMHAPFRSSQLCWSTLLLNIMLDKMV